MDCSGQDAHGKVAYASPEELWNSVSGQEDQSWYTPAVEYWDQQPASYDGVLAGLGHLSGDDIADSKKFLQKVYKRQLTEAEAGKRKLIVADCGAGVGRVTEQLLLHHFAIVDLIEPSKHLMGTAEQNLSTSGRGVYPEGHKSGQYFNMGLQAWTPEAGRYDVIWMQWALLYLTDDDLLQLLERCKSGLKEDGLVIIKENVCEQGFVVDQEDSSLTRSDAYFLDLLKRAEYVVTGSAVQRNFPKGLFKVKMYAAKPRSHVGT
ncbi:g12384 [Coccomyxa viridis]|uniref:Alpha N-terminal protein methyltransferase 1 n=1 Tax=Coccomyxa viridis TaxID=1274662 RepID=A0ABP1GEV1_9CHLO